MEFEEFLGPSKVGEIRIRVWDATFQALDKNYDELISQDEFMSDLKIRLKFRIAQFDRLDSEIKRREDNSLMEKRLIRGYKRVGWAADSNRN